MDLRRAQVATGANDGLQIPYRPLTGGNTFGIPYAYQWVYTQPSRVEDRALVIRLRRIYSASRTSACVQRGARLPGRRSVEPMCGGHACARVCRTVELPAATRRRSRNGPACFV
jgi:hypothetical protein